MKKITSMITLISIMLSAKEGIYLNTTNLYAKTAVVTCTDEETDMVYCLDCNKNIWTFEGIEDWMPGDIVSMIMDTKNTSTIYDDEIVSVTYSGTYEDLSPYGSEESENDISEDDLFKEYLEEIACGNYAE